MTDKLFYFIDLVDEIYKFMTDNFVATESQQELLKSLQCWKDIVPLLRTTYIINKNDTKAEQDRCEEYYEILLVEMKTTIRIFLCAYRK